MEYIDTVSELNYLTQIVIMLYEDSSEEEDSERRFHVELHFSPGAYGCSDVVHPVREIHAINAPLSREASLLRQIDPISSNINNIRTVLPKSHREAAHSPPRHRVKIAMPPLPAMPISQLPPASSSPEPTLSVDDSTPLPVCSETANPKMINQRSPSAKTIYRASSAMTTSHSSEHADCLDSNGHPAQRKRRCACPRLSRSPASPRFHSSAFDEQFALETEIPRRRRIQSST